MDRKELLSALKSEDRDLEERLRALEQSADSAPGGIRQYRYTRIEQVRDRQEQLRLQLGRIRSVRPVHFEQIRFDAEFLLSQYQDLSLSLEPQRGLVYVL